LRVSGAASAIRASAHDRLRVRSRPLRLPYGFQRRAGPADGTTTCVAGDAPDQSLRTHLT
jgi:hypothetical protein